MLHDELKKALVFYYITDDSAPDCAPVEQARIAVQAGATIIQYRNKSFSMLHFQEAITIRNLCKCNGIPFIINDDILLAKAVSADGVHLGQEDESPAVARQVLGDGAIVGVSVSTPEELEKTDLGPCDYIGTGPVFPTGTKTDAKATIGLSGLAAVVSASTLPVVAIGGIDDTSAKSCLEQGASGVAVISNISRSKDPAESARNFGQACGVRPIPSIVTPWNDEFSLIEKLLISTSESAFDSSHLKVPPGDDAALLQSIKNPVITTDTQKEGIHFRFDWQTPEEVGYKAVVITLSDLAASYATPVSLFVNLSLPPYVSDRLVENIYIGINKALNTYDCTLGGGNISASRSLSIDLFAIGEGNDAIFPTRSAAKPDHGLYCTGPIGLARTGLDALRKKDSGFEDCITAFKSPVARFEAAKVLADSHVECVMDISDGLAGDARHIAEASGVTIAFSLEYAPLSSSLVSYCKKYDLVPEEMVLAGGEDYELLFTCPEEIFIAVQKKLPEAYCVGRCLPFNGTYLINLPPGVSSFQHGDG